MDIKQIVKWTITLIAVLVIQHANANQQGDIYRTSFDHTEAMPDHVAYLMLMQDLRQQEQTRHHAEAITAIEHHLALDSSHAELFLQFMISSYDTMVETNRAVTNRMLCAGSKPRYDDSQAYQVLDVLDDIKETNLRKYYRRALDNFGVDTAQALGKWLDVIKAKSSHHTLDHRQAFLHSDESVEQAIGTACNVIAAY